MLYFSELQGKRIFEDKGTEIGKLSNFIFLAAESPFITKLIIKDNKRRLYVPIEDLKEIADVIVLKQNFQYLEKASNNNEISLTRNLLDKQIIDVKGGKVVRVNDVVIQHSPDNQMYHIAGVDIGLRAILRRLGVEKIAIPFYRLFRLYSHPEFLSWGDIEPLELAHGHIQLKKDARDLEKLRPEDLADYLEKTTIKNVNEIIENLNTKFAAKVVADLNLNYQTTLFKHFSIEKDAKLIEMLDPDEGIDILLSLSKDRRDEIISSLSETKRVELKELLHYSKTPLQGLISTNFLTIFAEDTVHIALERIKNNVTDLDFSPYLYVLNNDKELTGVMDLVELIKETAETPIFKIMEQDLVVIHITTPKEIATKKMLRYKRYALPVVEGNKRLVGIVKYEALVKDILKKL
jgi:magnesium transporter